MSRAPNDIPFSAFHLTAPDVAAGSGRGRKRQGGERTAGGRLKPPGATPEALAQRQTFAADPLVWLSPLDAAYAAGWIEPSHHKAGVAYVALYWRAGRAPDGPRRRITADLGEVGNEETAHLHGKRIRDLRASEIVEIWNVVFDVMAGTSEDERERREAEIRRRWRSLNERLEPAQRAEIVSVCVNEEWPRWLRQRMVGREMRDRLLALADEAGRELTVRELDAIQRRFVTPWEAQRGLLTGGLETVARVMAEAPKADRRAPRAPRAPAPRYIGARPLPPKDAPPIGTHVIGEETHVYDDGEVAFEVEHREARVRK